MQITVADLNGAFLDEWRAGEEASIHRGSILDVVCDAFVSPANSFGFMDGGVDYAYSQFFGWQVQDWLQDQLKLRPFGELLVGEALLVPTDHRSVPYVISAPTMRVPRVIHDPADVYLATRAAVKLAVEVGLSHIAFPGMGTGCGAVAFPVAAEAMRKGILDGLQGCPKPSSWQEAQFRHFLIGSAPPHLIGMNQMDRPEDIPEEIWELCRSAWLEQEDIAPSKIDYDGWRAIEFAARRLTLSKARSEPLLLQRVE